MDSWTDPPSNIVYAGISELVFEDSSARFAVVIRSASELVGFFECKLSLLPSQEVPTAVPAVIVDRLIQYRNSHNNKFAGVSFPRHLSEQCPSLSPKLWKDLDALPIVIGREPHPRSQADQGKIAIFSGWEEKQLDEQADSLVRKCIRSFGIGHVPLVHLDLHGMVDVNNGIGVSVVDVMDYQQTVGDPTWRLVQHYANTLKNRRVKVAFFSATPHGRPDAHTRHALIRLSQYLGVDFRWYVPRPRPQLLPIIRKVERILHCVSRPAQRLTTDEELHILEWVYTTAKRYWLSEGGPLQPTSDMGADLVVIDDAILSPLALISKQSDPRRPVIFENRLHVHHGHADDPASSDYETWEFIRARLKHVDLLVSQGPRGLVPRLMPASNTGYISATIDQLDGLNKSLHDWDISFYGREFNALCRRAGQMVIQYPDERYILHLAKLIPDEGTICLLDAYKDFYHQCFANIQDTLIPKLLLCHYRSPNDEDSTPIYASLLAHIESHMPYLTPFICLVQLRPPDQLWNVLLSKAMAMVQLCDSEGIPETLLGAVQKGIPVVASRNCGYLSFLDDGRNALLLDGCDVEGLSHYLLGLAMDTAHGEQLGTIPGRKTLNDRTTTVGNAVNWFFLASKLSRGETFEPSEGDIYTFAEQEATQ